MLKMASGRSSLGSSTSRILTSLPAQLTKFMMLTFSKSTATLFVCLLATLVVLVQYSPLPFWEFAI